MSLLAPHEHEQLNQYILEKNAAMTFEEQLANEKTQQNRPTIASFFENRPKNNIFLETSHE